MRSVALFCSALLMSAASLSAQVMPIPLGAIYVATSTSSDGMTVSATSVADTMGQSGHTIVTQVKITTPDGRISYGFGSWGYSSQASTYVPVCAWGVCYDGTYLASSEGTQEFCPIANQYVVDPVQQVQQQIEKFVFTTGIAAKPAQISKQNGLSVVAVHYSKSSGCPASSVTVDFWRSSNPTTMGVTHDPINHPAGSFNGLSGHVEFNVRTTQFNEQGGTISVTGEVTANNGGCVNRNTPKQTTISVPN